MATAEFSKFSGILSAALSQHYLLGFEIDVFLELSCFCDDPADVGNLISGSSAFSKSSLNIIDYAKAFAAVLSGHRSRPGGQRPGLAETAFFGRRR